MPNTMQKVLHDHGRFQQVGTDIDQEKEDLMYKVEPFHPWEFTGYI